MLWRCLTGSVHMMKIGKGSFHIGQETHPQKNQAKILSIKGKELPFKLHVIRESQRAERTSPCEKFVCTERVISFVHRWLSTTEMQIEKKRFSIPAWWFKVSVCFHNNWCYQNALFASFTEDQHPNNIDKIDIQTICWEILTVATLSGQI